MLIKDTLPADAGTAYHTFLDVVLPSFEPPVKQMYFRSLPNPMKGKIEVTRVDSNPEHIHHLELQCYLTVPAAKYELGKPIHVHFLDEPASRPGECIASFDARESHQFGGALFTFFLKVIPAFYFRIVNGMNRAVGVEYRIENHSIPWAAHWKTKEAYASGLGQEMLKATISLMFDRTRTTLQVSATARQAGT
ncbi:hypothetical protein MQE23_06975 [Streptomyces sp. HP-A2021]|uniref:hypothetical protein n=1 Tax=Streptomyces sp. HP-A2021 TaxID=2927875 RepID=UPI001FB02AE5|nr:hypothetical protein [Streptomyces sp. HP-A2021]UOB08810.1 hypothetical protein MQE23_06975 [Streptomyces sp. HP-A2021]